MVRNVTLGQKTWLAFIFWHKCNDLVLYHLHERIVPLLQEDKFLRAFITRG